ncbi:MAG: PhoH-like protein [Dehalococcoidia bacterium]|nr:PhoH-like protein [Chloroflexota bacterium]
MPQQAKAPRKKSSSSAKARASSNKNALGFAAIPDVQPLTENQRQAILAWAEGNHLVLHGVAGTGKTYLSLAMALREVIELGNYRGIVIVRSAVPTRDVGFMPGTLAEKLAVYEQPYRDITNEVIGRGDAYDILKQKGIVDFMSTSFIRGLTLDRRIVIVDEMQNCNWGELTSIITRIGRDAKIVFSGDYRQSDFTKKAEREGLMKFLGVLRKLKGVEFIEFKEEDIVRSAFVKQFLIEMYNQGLDL